MTKTTFQFVMGIKQTAFGRPECVRFIKPGTGPLKVHDDLTRRVAVTGDSHSDEVPVRVESAFDLAA